MGAIEARYPQMVADLCRSIQAKEQLVFELTVISWIIQFLAQFAYIFRTSAQFCVHLRITTHNANGIESDE